MSMGYRRVIVVAAGTKGTGKDTVCDKLAVLLPSARRDAYAAPLKMCVHLKTGVPLEWLNDPAKKDDPKYSVYGKTLRLLMQEEGEEARQRIAPTVWADRLYDRHEAAAERITVVSDGRHPVQEIDGFRARAKKDTLVLGVRLRRPGVVIDRSHISESAIADLPDDVFDVVIVNDGPLSQLLDEKVTQLADYIYLRALGQKKPKGVCIRCPNGARFPWPFESEEAAAPCAYHLTLPCQMCLHTTADHKIEKLSFAGLVLPRE